MRLTLNQNPCTGCMACAAACRDAHREAGAPLRAVREGPGLKYRHTVCLHCARPACLPACPAGAIHRDAPTGAVLIDRARCTGCGRCAAACPLHIPVVTGGKAFKCDLCAGRLGQGLPPACAAACPLRLIGLDGD